jgi:hypothetical protein
MPKPIVCVCEQLRQYLEIFRDCFSTRQWKYFVIVLLGLIECEERKTLTGLLRMIGEQVSLSGLSRFLNKWRWSPEAVAQSWQAHFRQQLEPLVRAEHERLKALAPKGVGRPKQTVVTGYLIFDDSVHEKPKGRKMGGLGRHYSNTAQKVVTGHCLFTGLYVLLGQRCPLAARMYCQRSSCEREKQPFQSKVEMAVEEIEQFEPVVGTKTHVLIDSWYHCRQVRRAAQKRGWEVSGALKSNRWMRRMRPDGRREWLKLSDYAATVSRDEWCEIVWPSQEGEQRLYGHLVSTWVRKLGPTLLLITCHNLDAPPKTRRFWGSTLVDGDAQALVEILAIRWQVETFFEYEKDLLGSDHYQIMSRQAVLRFWALTACLLYFLEMQRTATSLTCGDVRHHIQHVHRRNLLEWLATRFRDGLSIDQIALLLAL